ncbi:MAG: hypothetical protein DRO88_02765 [Promethearchaeia archaeon]|nr:MAG: hypothetical protein DRO88_02765 [Candidatus Lokiarchaeia archaeon]
MEIPDIILVSPKSFQEYAHKTALHLESGTATEITYYDEFKQFLETIFPPSRGYLIQSGYKISGSRNKPDMTVTFNGMVLFHIEAKKPFTPVKEIIEYKPGSRLFNQIERYQKEGAQVLITDFLNLWLVKPKNSIQEQQPTTTKKIEFQFSCQLLKINAKKTLIPAKNASSNLQQLLTATCSEHLQNISNVKKLIHPLASIAIKIKEKTKKILMAFLNGEEMSSSQKKAAQYLIQIKEDFAKSIFKEEKSPKIDMFADLFAQTLVYGAFSAWIKYHQQNPDKSSKFSLYTVGDYLPFGSFLRNLFLNLKNQTPLEFKPLFQEMEVRFQKTQFKPIISNSETLITTFYSDFLNLYDPKTAKERGVIYTPYEVVEFIIKGIDFFLKRWFNKRDGILSRTVKKELSSKNLLNIPASKFIQQKLQTSRPLQIPIQCLRILDPAAGTMAFASGLLHIAKELMEKKYEKQPGLAHAEFKDWVISEFFGNVYSFEILMAPYVLGHIRTFLTLDNLGLPLKAVDYPLKSYLMNTLMSPPKDKTLDEWMFHNTEIGKEIKEALRIRDKEDIFVIMGNPPYNLSSQNDCKWINEKIQDYKQDLQERNKKILSDDYVKFIRFAQWKIEQVGKGIVAFITNNKYLDGQMFSVMRKSLQKTFDHIYIVNLHGDYRKKESGNPFNIKVGVCIAFMIRIDNCSPKNAAIHYMDVPNPTKESKFEILAQGFDEKRFKLLPPTPKSFFVDIDTTFLTHYQSFVPLNKFFRKRPISGIMAGKDRLVIDCDPQNLEKNMEAFFHKKFSLLDKWQIRYNDTKSWNRAKVYSKTSFSECMQKIKPILYRGWDYRYIVYDRHILEGHRMGYIDMITADNPALTVTKSSRKKNFCTAWIADKLIEKCYMSVTDTAYAFLLSFKGKSNMILPDLPYSVTDKQMFYYIYAVLHCPHYRTRYDEFLRKDFPRIPLPADGEIFYDLSKLGQNLTEIHLLQLDIDPRLETADIGADEWIIRDYYYDSISETLYLSKNKIPWIRPISLDVWKFSLGGITQIPQFLNSRIYSKERKWNTIRRPLSFEELTYLLKMITAIKKTLQIIPKINSLYQRLDP